jgi:soluble lytic murein transglycosylase-like protein
MIPEALMWAIMWVESMGDPKAISPAGARGLYQIMPITANHVTQLHNNFPQTPNLFSPKVNRRYADTYLKWLVRNTSSWREVLIAYNWGIGRIKKKRLPRETRNYLRKVTFLWEQTHYDNLRPKEIESASIYLPMPGAWRHRITTFD